MAPRAESILGTLVFLGKGFLGVACVFLTGFIMTRIPHEIGMFQAVQHITGLKNGWISHCLLKHGYLH
jgi:hypothetical protein